MSQPVSNTSSTSGTTSPKRDLSLDFLKGLSILFVVFFHNIQLNPDSIADNLFMLAANAAVPCFFLVSGALFFSRPFRLSHHLYRILRFYLVVVAWRGIYLFLYHSWGTPLDGSLKALASYLFLFQTVNGVETGHFWFMDAMLTVMLIAPFLRICLEDHEELLPFLLGMLFLFNQLLADGNLILALFFRMIGKSSWDISSFAEISPFSLRYSNYMLYYLLGALLMREGRPAWMPSFRLASFCRTGFLPAVFGLLGLVLIKYLQSGTIRWQNLHITSGYYWISTMLLACGLFLMARQLPVNRIRPLRWFASVVGSSTMGVFYLHIPMIFLLRPTLFAALSAYNGWLLNLAESALIVAGSCVITWIGRKIPIIKHLF